MQRPEDDVDGPTLRECLESDRHQAAVGVLEERMNRLREGRTRAVLFMAEGGHVFACPLVLVWVAGLPVGGVVQHSPEFTHTGEAE